MDINVAKIEDWEDWKHEAEQASEAFTECIKLILLGCGNTGQEWSDNTPDAELENCFKEYEYDFKINIINGTELDYDSVREGLAESLTGLAQEFCVEFEIERLENNDYRVVMTQTEETIFA